MKTFLLTILISVTIVISTFGQITTIYKGESRSNLDALITLKDSIIYNTYKNEPIYIIKNKKIFGLDNMKRPSTKPLLVINGNKIMLEGNFGSNTLYTIDGNNVHLGDGNFMNNTIAYRIENNRVYLGDSAWHPTLYTIDGEIDLTIIACFLFLGAR